MTRKLLFIVIFFLILGAFSVFSGTMGGFRGSERPKIWHSGRPCYDHVSAHHSGGGASPDTGSTSRKPSKSAFFGAFSVFSETLGGFRGSERPEIWYSGPPRHARGSAHHSGGGANVTQKDSACHNPLLLSGQITQRKSLLTLTRRRAG